MLSLTLVRHAKSSWDSGANDDHSRPLNPRGQRDAPIIAKALIDRGVAPDRCLVSTATRTRETADAFIRQGLINENCVQYEQALYLASPDHILDVLQSDFLSQKEPPKRLLVIAHNPGLEVLAANLSAFKTGPMPTAAVAHFAIQADDFAVMNTTTAKLEFFISPKGLRGSTGQ